MLGFVRTAAVTPRIALANPEANAEFIFQAIGEAIVHGANIIVTPALALTGATCGDLFNSPTLIKRTQIALTQLQAKLKDFDAICVVGLPIAWNNMLFSAAAVIQSGELLGVVPQVAIAPRSPLNTARHFSNFANWTDATWQGIPLGEDLRFTCGACTFAVLVGDDLTALEDRAYSPVANGAQLILHLGAEPETLCRAAFRRDIVRSLSLRFTCACVSAWAGSDESSAFGTFSGHRLLANNGRLLSEARWEQGVSFMDFNPTWLDVVRQRDPVANSYPPTFDGQIPCPTPIAFDANCKYAGLKAHPFIPEDEAACAERCEEMLQIQAHALARRFKHIHAKRLVLGLSGGLDSTLALVVCVKMCELLHLPMKTILGITMPGFGTGERTRTNVDILAEAYGIELREIPIGDAVMQHFKDIGHDPAVLDVTYENAQARERTQILMDLANQENGLLVGTGDLSEIALGWSTYNGDHMSMYSVNANVPKTLIRPCLEVVAKRSPEALATVLHDICATPVSPELLPGGKQETENIVGRYEIHDLYLYYFIKYGAGRNTLFALGKFLLHLSDEMLNHTLDIFFKRFMQQQFKRSCAPDAPLIGTISLNAAFAWCMPADI